MSELHPEYAIDIEKVIAKKFPGKKFPKWFIRWIKNFIHQDFLNEFFVKGYEGIEFCTECTKALDITLDVKGLENVKVPEGARITFASNHPLGGIDGVTLTGLVGTHFSDRGIRLLVNDFLMAIKGLSSMSIPVSKTGAQARELPRLVNEIYESQDNIVLFPAGLCSRKIDGKIQDLPWTKSFVKMSAKTGRWVVPVHFIGRNSNRFYNIARLCKWLKLKFNFAMLFLPDELYRAQHSTYKVVFGEPIPPETFDSSKTPAEWAAWVREKAYSLE